MPEIAAGTAKSAAVSAGPLPRIATMSAIASEPADLHVEEDAERAERPSLERPEEVRESPRQARAERESDRPHRATLAVRNGTRRSDRVELIRVVEHRRLGGAGRACVVVAGDRVQELRTGGCLE